MFADVQPFLQRLQQATNAHDLDAILECFARNYRNEAPAHPSRNFQGTDQVRDNWRQIFAFVPDVQASVLSWAGDGCEVWSEWEMSGTLLDRSRHLMRGVIIFGLEEGLATSARFYLEPVDDDDTTTNAGDAVRHHVHADTPP